MIIEHRLEDVLWRNVDRIILMKDGGILADLHPDELLSTGLLGENGIREPLYLTAMRYAGVDILPEKKPSHVDSVIINESDRTKIHNWFHAQPTAEKEADKSAAEKTSAQKAVEDHAVTDNMVTEKAVSGDAKVTTEPFTVTVDFGSVSYRFNKRISAIQPLLQVWQPSF